MLKFIVELDDKSSRNWVIVEIDCHQSSIKIHETNYFPFDRNIPVEKDETCQDPCGILDYSSHCSIIKRRYILKFEMDSWNLTRCPQSTWCCKSIAKYPCNYIPHIHGLSLNYFDENWTDVFRTVWSLTNSSSSSFGWRLQEIYIGCQESYGKFKKLVNWLEVWSRFRIIR